MSGTTQTPGNGLDKNILEEGIKEANKAVRDLTDKDEIEDVWAKKLAEVIDNYVRSGKVMTTGTATNQTGIIT